ncbi:hypothetical protein BDZ97DRAFT_1761863 [Flammula alnicola]|nr:hypothetical protein BDZ97DRAFT_1761863 [Flammula alnicola]
MNSANGEPAEAPPEVEKIENAGCPNCNSSEVCPEEKSELAEYMHDVEAHIDAWVDSWYLERAEGGGKGFVRPMKRAALRRIERQVAELDDLVAPMLETLPNDLEERRACLDWVMEMTKRITCGRGILGVVLDNEMAEDGAEYNLYR